MAAKRRLFLAASLLVAVAAWLPYWGFVMSAPQYPDESLTLHVSHTGIGGDVQEVETLQQYIGVRFPKQLPELDDDFASSYSGVIVGELLLLDGHDADTESEDRVMLFGRSALRGGTLPDPAPPGMWVGLLGSDLLITVESKAEPARGRVLRITP